MILSIFGGIWLPSQEQNLKEVSKTIINLKKYEKRLKQNPTKSFVKIVNLLPMVETRHMDGNCLKLDQKKFYPDQKIKNKLAFRMKKTLKLLKFFCQNNKKNTA